jgi:hypothetical protein
MKNQPERHEVFVGPSIDLASLGVPGLAYIKRVEEENGVAWAIHGAEGTRIGLAPSRELAFAAVIQHELEPVSVH